MTVDIPAGLLLVFGRLGENVSEDEFNDWHDNEHGPARLTVPGIDSALRYVARDGQEPKYAAVYNLRSPSVLESEEYKRLFPNASDAEKSLIARIASLQRRVYTLVSTLQHPATASAPDALPGKYALLSMWEPLPENEVEFNKWFDEEHFPLVSRVPGYLRARRFKLTAVNDIAGGAPPPTDVPAYLAFYEWADAGFLEREEMKAAQTEWAAKITLGSRPIPPDTRIMEFYKAY
ncbi:hypothetical protein HDZ31DRAFT_35648 [Schizophyllum fasciatum]